MRIPIQIKIIISMWIPDPDPGSQTNAEPDHLGRLSPDRNPSEREIRMRIQVMQIRNTGYVKNPDGAGFRHGSETGIPDLSGREGKQRKINLTVDPYGRGGGGHTIYLSTW